MGALLTFSQASLLLLPKVLLQHPRQQWNHNAIRSSASPLHFIATNSISSPIIAIQKKQFVGTRVGVISDSKAPTIFTADSAGAGVDVLEDIGGSGGEFGNSSGGGGGGGGGDDGSDDNNYEGEGESDESKDESSKTGMSMSQKLTLGYALLIGAGGVMGFLKSGSQKSLLAGGLSAALLFYVYSVLPTNPVLASSLGLGLSAALLMVMGSRFKRSGKIFPAGVVSFVSFIMSGGYLHGILRSLH